MADLFGGDRGSSRCMWSMPAMSVWIMVTPGDDSISLTTTWEGEDLKEGRAKAFIPIIFFDFLIFQMGLGEGWERVGREEDGGELSHFQSNRMAIWSGYISNRFLVIGLYGGTVEETGLVEVVVGKTWKGQNATGHGLK